MTKRHVYPVDGFFLNDQPHVEHDCDRDLCVASGAFTTTPPKTAATKTQDPPDGGSSDSTEE